MAAKSFWSKPLNVIGVGIAALGVAWLLTRQQQTQQTGLSMAAPAQPPTAMGGDVLVSTAMRETGLPESEIVVRGIRPQDFGAASSDWSVSLTGSQFTTAFNTTVADNTFIEIQGVSYSGTNVRQIRVDVGGSTVAFLDVTNISSLENPIVYFYKPIYASQNQSITVQMFSTATSTESVQFMGRVAQKRGILINP